MSKVQLSRKMSGFDDGFAAEAAAVGADPVPGGLGQPKPAARSTQEPSLRDRLAEFFRSGHNGSDRELAARFGASVGSISVYRCQLKKLGVGVASPPVARGAGASLDTRAGSTRQRRRGDAANDGRSAAPLNVAEIDHVLVQNIETELGLIVERYPDLAAPVANVQQTLRLLHKLRRH